MPELSPSPRTLEDGRRTIRGLLMVVVVVGTGGLVFLLLKDLLSPISVVASGLFAGLSLRSLPAGTRVAGWLFALWAGVSLVLVGRSTALTESLGMGNMDAALAGAVGFRVLAGTGFWACRGRRG